MVEVSEAGEGAVVEAPPGGEEAEEGEVVAEEALVVERRSWLSHTDMKVYNFLMADIKACFTAST